VELSCWYDNKYCINKVKILVVLKGALIDELIIL
jgi:hypothetical protein